jgi:hypothetical protein
MYIPPFDSLLNALGATRKEFNRVDQITLPVPLLKILLQMANAASDFNESGYLRENPDIAAAVKTGEIQNAKLHYIGFGYFEGRLGAVPEVDDSWYLGSNPDVAKAVARQEVASASEHFNVIGAGEGRSPSKKYETVAAQWKKVLVRD